MPDFALQPRPSAALPVAAAAALPSDLAFDDSPTVEEFADALNVAKNAALDTLVVALSARTGDGLPTREALFAAARILALSAHSDRLAAARRSSIPPARQAAGSAAPDAPRHLAPATDNPLQLPAATGAAFTAEPRVLIRAAAPAPQTPAQTVPTQTSPTKAAPAQAPAAPVIPSSTNPAAAPRTPAFLHHQANTAPRKSAAPATTPWPSAERNVPFLSRNHTTDFERIRTLLDAEAFLDADEMPELDALLVHGPSP